MCWAGRGSGSGSCGGSSGGGASWWKWWGDQLLLQTVGGVKGVVEQVVDGLDPHRHH